MPGQHELFVIAQTRYALCLGFGLGQRRQKHAGQNRDDRDNDQQLDQCESPGSSAAMEAVEIRNRTTRCFRALDVILVQNSKGSLGQLKFEKI